MGRELIERATSELAGMLRSAIDRDGTISFVIIAPQDLIAQIKKKLPEGFMMATFITGAHPEIRVDAGQEEFSLNLQSWLQSIEDGEL